MALVCSQRRGSIHAVSHVMPASPLARHGVMPCSAGTASSRQPRGSAQWRKLDRLRAKQAQQLSVVMTKVMPSTRLRPLALQPSDCRTRVAVLCCMAMPLQALMRRKQPVL